MVPFFHLTFPTVYHLSDLLKILLMIQWNGMISFLSALIAHLKCLRSSTAQFYDVFQTKSMVFMISFNGNFLILFKFLTKFLKKSYAVNLSSWELKENITLFSDSDKVKEVRRCQDTQYSKRTQLRVQKSFYS